MNELIELAGATPPLVVFALFVHFIANFIGMVTPTKTRFRLVNAMLWVVNVAALNIGENENADHPDKIIKILNQHNKEFISLLQTVKKK